MLLVLDMHIPGIVRERILVAYHRYGSGKIHGDSSIEDICMLLRSTGFTNASDSKRIQNYPEEYFRFVNLQRMLWCTHSSQSIFEWYFSGV